MPYSLQQLQSDDKNDEVSEVERRGEVDGLSEVLLNRRDLLPSCLYGTLLPSILKGETNETEADALALFQSCAHSGMQAFCPGGHFELPLGALRGCNEAVDCHRAGVGRRVRRCLSTFAVASDTGGSVLRT